MTASSTASYSRVRWAARAPRLLAALLVLALSAAGLRATLAPSVAPRPPVQHEAPRHVAAEGIAERFARVYLSWDPRRPRERDRRLAAMSSVALEPGAGYAPPEGASEAVRWTAVVGQTLGPRGRTVVVAVETSRRLLHLEVPIARDRSGRLFVADYPALVGGPATTSSAERSEGPEVADGELRAVVVRALGNYLEGDGLNLRADLVAGASASLPGTPLELLSVDPVTRVGPGRVAALASVEEPTGGELRLRYELQVVRRERWYVRAIGSTPTQGRTG